MELKLRQELELLLTQSANWDRPLLIWQRIAKILIPFNVGEVFMVLLLVQLSNLKAIADKLLDIPRQGNIASTLPE